MGLTAHGPVLTGPGLSRPQLKSGSPFVVSLTDPLATDPARVGRKAASLALLLRAGCLVPGGYVLTVEGCTMVADGTPGDLLAVLAGPVRALGDVALAVRSSGTAEDLESASFAGQYDSVLAVRGLEAVAEAVRDCLASGSSRRLEAYRRATEVSGPAALAVLVQHLVEAEAAGVAFTADPVSGDTGEVHVSAARGLGQRLVGGEVDADVWVVRDGVAQRTASGERVLDADLALRVAALARQVEGIMGAPQDVEWALAGDSVYVLQARPMTALPRPPRVEVPAEGFWEKDDWHYAGPMTAFGASVYLPAVEIGLATWCREFGILPEGEQQRWIGHEVYGRTVPYRGRPWPRWPWWLFGIVARLSPEMRRRADVADRALRTALAERYLECWERTDREALRDKAAALRAVDLPALDDAALLGHLDRAIDLLRRGQIAHFRLNAPYGLALRDLYRAGREMLGWGPPQVLQLLAGSSSISSEPARRLGEVARMAARTPAARSVLQEGGADTVLRLRTAAPGVAQMLDSYVDEYSHRPMGYDPGGPTLAERTELVIALSRDAMVASGGDAGSRSARSAARERAAALLVGRSASDRARFESVLAAAERVYPVREESIFFGDSLPSGVLRYTALEFGRRLVAGRVLRAVDDAVHLTEAELRSALAGARGDLRAIVARRRAERAWVMAHPGPPSYGRREGTPPDPRALPHALRRFNEAWLAPAAPEPRDEGSGSAIAGTPASAGRHLGAVRIVRDESEFDRLRPGEVLVCRTASPAWSILFGQAGALVTDTGSASSHPAIVAREHGIPAVVGTGDATRRLRDGQVVLVDGTAGLVHTSPDPATAT